MGNLLKVSIGCALLALTGCGSSSSSAPPVSGNDPPVTPPVQDTIEGVATPSSVAVVTATNAQ